MQTLRIEAYDVASYTEQVIKAAAEGYKVSETIDHYPQHFHGIGLFVATLVKEPVKEAVASGYGKEAEKTRKPKGE